MKNHRVIEGEAFETGSGNVFADLGLPNPEERLLKAQLMIAIGNEIERRKLTQAQASQLLGLAQSDLSRISNGRGSGFSVERLMEALRYLGRDIEIVVSSARGPIGKLDFRESGSKRMTPVRKRQVRSPKKSTLPKRTKATNQ